MTQKQYKAAETLLLQCRQLLENNTEEEDVHQQKAIVHSQLAICMLSSGEHNQSSSASLVCKPRTRVCAGAAVQLLKDALQLSRANKNRRQQYDIIGYLFDVCMGRQHYKAAKQHAERQLQLALALKVSLCAYIHSVNQHVPHRTNVSRATHAQV
jgi:hypothetical protein